MEEYSASLSTAVAKHARVEKIVNGRGKKWLPCFFLKALWSLLFSRADVYHATDGVGALLIPVIKVFKARPAVTTVHGLDITRRGLLYRIIVWCIRLSDRIVAVSDHTREECLRRRIDPRRIEVIGHGLNIGKYPLPRANKDPNMMIAVGRQVKRKGIAHFIDTRLSEILEDYPHLKFYIIGTGPERKNIAGAICRSRFRDRIWYLGKIADAELFRYYEKATYFAAPNIKVPGDMEGFGLVILEAIFYQTIILANPIEGLKDALSHARNWIDLRQERIDLKVSYREQPPPPSWDEVVEKYLDIYRGLYRR